MLLIDDADQTMEQSLFSWLSDQYTGDNDSRSAAKRVLAELFVFYILIVIGFGGLWLTWHSNTEIKKVREGMKQVLQQQRDTRFDASDSKMYL